MSGLWQKAVSWVSGKVRVERLNNRKLQQEMDIHKLFLLTSFHAEIQSGQRASKELAERISSESKSLDGEGLKTQVGENLKTQFDFLANTLHQILQEHDDTGSSNRVAKRLLEQNKEDLLLNAEIQKEESAPKKRKRGLGAAVGGPLVRTSNPSISQRKDFSGNGNYQPKLSLPEISKLLQDRLGFTSEVQKSSQAGGQSGLGVWIKGKANLGSIVSLYPGIVHPPSAYKHIPGYPKVDRDNDYLIARFDDLVIDAQPWQHDILPEIAKNPIAFMPKNISKEREEFIRQLYELEVRNPLATAHYANHPSKEVSPNVVIANLDFPISEGKEWQRAYLPNIQAGTDRSQNSSTPNLKDLFQNRQESSSEQTLKGLVLVATRPLEDEELLLNYRLSTHVSRPEWYHPVDSAEDQRRWA